MLYAVLREIGGEIPPGYSPERDSAADNYCGAIPLDFYNSFGDTAGDRGIVHNVCILEKSSRGGIHRIRWSLKLVHYCLKC